MKYYFASDVHLGLDLGPEGGRDPGRRERCFVSWLKAVEAALTPEGDGKPKGALFLLGDLFDFWFEYRRTVPKGFVRVLGQLARMTDAGIEVRFFTGNHDIWTFGYLEKEAGLIVHRRPEVFVLEGKTFFLAHGHGLGVSDRRYRAMNGLFNSRRAYALCSRLVHPDFLLRFGLGWSHSSRSGKALSHVFRGEDEPLVRFARRYAAEGRPADYFVFGHLHTPVVYPLGPGRELVVLGEWIERPVYGLYENGVFRLETYACPEEDSGFSPASR